MSSLLDHDVETLPGIGPRSAAILKSRGHESVGDLLWLLPKRYLDQRHPTPIHELEAGEYVVVEGRVRSARRFPRGRHMGFEVRIESELPVDSQEGYQEGYQELKLVWFRAVPGLTRRFEVGATVRVAGQVNDYRGVATIAHPETLAAESEGEIEPRYPDIPGLKRKSLRKAVRAAVDRAAHQVPDLIPEAQRVSRGLGRVGQALRSIHVPTDETVDAGPGAAHPAQQRLALEELVLWELALRMRRAKEPAGAARAFEADPHVSIARNAFAFDLTAAQLAAVDALGRSLNSEDPMRCLLQGDVGCGKTAVALVACAQVVAGGAQAAFLAPTELLAEQHAMSLRPVAERLGIRLGVFTGTLSKHERRSMLDRMSTGAVDLIVGTHALLSGDIRFSSLGLLVVDEQHRFGVAQRLVLGVRDARHQPHLLVMTATPIPRSLALVLYSGLDLVVIDAKPPGRLPPKTVRVTRRDRAKVYRQIERALEAGGRVFIVCPAISESDGIVGVDAVAAEMGSRFGEDVVGTIHGRLGGDERRTTMRAFADGDIKVLVGTTVVEVGVDVPSANLIVVEQADRFGLAQLHQLRGRVGRDGQRSACLLTHPVPLTPEAETRLQALCETDDGFKLAEADLALRGPGHLFGYRQSGASGLRFADLGDVALLSAASEIAGEILAEDPLLSRPENARAAAAVARWERFAAVREEAG
ncbi:MAG: ATP-dependent DNA helicase RecG [Myxococcota bacterium]